MTGGIVKTSPVPRGRAVAIILGVLCATALLVSLSMSGTTKAGLDSCTIFSISQNGTAFFCDNEDEGLRHGRVWFLPRKDAQHGLVLFCYAVHRNVMIPIGGINDQGLCFDQTIVHETEIRLDPDRPDCVGTFSLEMLRECGTVLQAESWARSRDLLMLDWQQVHLADSTGDAVVLGLDSGGALWLTNKTGDYLISVPVNHAQSIHGLGHRYESVRTMLDRMLRETGGLTLDGCRLVLEEASVPDTMFSYIHVHVHVHVHVQDQQDGCLYLYSRGDFDRVAYLDIEEELSRGAHSYDIERIVSRQTQTGRKASVSADAFDDGLGASLAVSIALVSIVAVMAVSSKKEVHPPDQRDGLPGWRSSPSTMRTTRTTRTGRGGRVGSWNSLTLVGLVWAVLIASSLVLVRIPILIPTQWVSVVFFVSITPVFLFSISALVGPRQVIGICFPVLALGELFWCYAHGCGGELSVNIALTFGSLGIGCLVISLLRERSLVIAMLVGAGWTFVGVLVPAVVYYALILNWNALYMVVYSLLTMAQNLALVPFALVLSIALRRLVDLQP